MGSPFFLPVIPLVKMFVSSVQVMLSTGLFGPTIAVLLQASSLMVPAELQARPFHRRLLPDIRVEKARVRDPNVAAALPKTGIWFHSALGQERRLTSQISGLNQWHHRLATMILAMRNKIVIL